MMQIAESNYQNNTSN